MERSRKDCKRNWRDFSLCVGRLLFPTVTACVAFAIRLIGVAFCCCSNNITIWCCSSPTPFPLWIFIKLPFICHYYHLLYCVMVRYYIKLFNILFEYPASGKCDRIAFKVFLHPPIVSYTAARQYRFRTDSFITFENVTFLKTIRATDLFSKTFNGYHVRYFANSLMAFPISSIASCIPSKLELNIDVSFFWILL
jgi:hypothetical protein